MNEWHGLTPRRQYFSRNVERTRLNQEIVEGFHHDENIQNQKTNLIKSD